MGCDFRERIQEQILAKPGTFQVEQVKAHLLQLVGEIGVGSDALVKTVPPEVGGYKLRGQFEAQQPRWRGDTLPFSLGFKVQAQFLFWIDVVEVVIKGSFDLRAKQDLIERLNASLELRFEARSQAMQALDGRIPAVEGQPAPRDTCQAVQGLLSQQATQFLRQVSTQTRRSLQAFKR